MKDTKAIIHTLKNRIKVNIFGKSKYGNREWKEANNDWYESMHDGNYLLHEDFIKYFKKKSSIHVLEVGCGTGIYPIRNKELFANKLVYTRYFKGEFFRSRGPILIFQGYVS